METVNSIFVGAYILYVTVSVLCVAVVSLFYPPYLFQMQSKQDFKAFEIIFVSFTEWTRTLARIFGCRASHTSFERGTPSSITATLIS